MHTSLPTSYKVTCKACGKQVELPISDFGTANKVNGNWYCDEHIADAKQSAEDAKAAFEAKRQQEIEERNAKAAAVKVIRKQRIAEREQNNLEQFEKLSRAEQNAILRDRGYTWNKYTKYDETQEEDGYYWELSSADGRVVSVARAIDEIRRGVEVVAVEYAAKQAAAEKNAAAEAKAEQEQAAADEAQIDAAYAAFDAEAKRLTAGMVQVKRFAYWNQAENVQTVYKMQPLAAGTTSRRYDYIQSMTVKGVSVIVTITGSGYDDDGYSSIYCADPTAAGLTPYTPSDLDRRFDLLFG